MGTKRLVAHTVYILSDQKTWLKEHPEFNLGGWIRPRLKKVIEDYNYLAGIH